MMTVTDFVHFSVNGHTHTTTTTTTTTTNNNNNNKVRGEFEIFTSFVTVNESNASFLIVY
jgi:hypothetical protein